MVAARLKDDCDYAVVAILDGVLHVENSASRCPPDSKIAESLNFLESMLRSQRLSVADVVFILCVKVSNVVEDVPIFLHSKIYGHDQPGILLPGPMHTTYSPEKNKKHSSAEAWEKRYDEIRLFTARTFSTKKTDTTWGSRHSRAVWRGRNPRYSDCSEDGTWARLEVVSLSLAHSALFDTRFTRKTEYDDVNVCIGRSSESPKEYQRHLKRLIYKYAPGTARVVPNLTEFLSRYRYVMHVPEKDGRIGPTLASLWALASVVILWESTCVDWYEPATRNGETHIVINADSAMRAVSLLVESDDFAQHLARRALELHENILNPGFVARYMAKAFNVYRMHFGFNTRDKGERGWLADLLKLSGLDLRRHSASADKGSDAQSASRQQRLEGDSSRRGPNRIFGFL